MSQVPKAPRFFEINKRMAPYAPSAYGAQSHPFVRDISQLAARKTLEKTQYFHPAARKIFFKRWYTHLALSIYPVPVSQESYILPREMNFQNLEENTHLD